MNFSVFKTDANIFLNNLFEKIEFHKIEIKESWQIDHICFRVEIDERYQFFKKQFLEFSELLIESEVGGRLISTFKFHQLLVFKNWKIDLVELPAPKKGKYTKEGFEHIEIVTDQSFESVVEFEKNNLMK